MTGPHTNALDHLLAEALHEAGPVRFRHDKVAGPETAYSADLANGEATFTALAESPIAALALAMRMLRAGGAQ